MYCRHCGQYCSPRIHLHNCTVLAREVAVFNLADFSPYPLESTYSNKATEALETGSTTWTEVMTIEEAKERFPDLSEQIDLHFK